MLKSLPVHMLWFSASLSRLARLSLASFQAQGYRLVLWSHAPEAHGGLGVEVRDAAEIVPRTEGEGAAAYLSSCFRYKLLSRQGGIWSDMDVVALAADPAAVAELDRELERQRARVNRSREDPRQLCSPASNSSTVSPTSISVRSPAATASVSSSSGTGETPPTGMAR